MLHTGDFVPCLPKDKYMLFYFGIILNCTSPILEAIFVTSCAMVVVDGVEFESLANRLMIDMICKIQGQHQISFTITNDVNFQWQFPKGLLTLGKNKNGSFVSLVANPLVDPTPLVTIDPFFTIHLQQRVSYSTETLKRFEIRYGCFENLIDFHIDRLVRILK